MSVPETYYAFTVNPEQKLSGFRRIGQCTLAAALKLRAPDDMLVVEATAVDRMLSVFKDLRNHDRLFLFEIEDSKAPNGGGWNLSILPENACDMGRSELYDECVPKYTKFTSHLLITVYSADEGTLIFRKHNVH